MPFRTDFNFTLPVAGETRITSAHVTEVLEATGLFSSRGSERVGWIHQTFLEFLATWFIKHIELPERQLTDLLTGKDQHIVPQLATLSLWVALHRPSILMRIVKTDPQIVLFSEQAPPDESFAKNLVEVFLAVKKEEQDNYSSFDIWRRYPILVHPSLAAQLSQYIQNSVEDDLIRQYAMNIGAACHALEIQPSLVALILNAQENQNLRIHALQILNIVGDAQSKLGIKALALTEFETLKNTRLCGALLNLLWPEVLSLDEFLPFLTLERPDGASHLLHHFFKDGLLSGIKKDDLVTLMSWLRKQDIDSESGRYYQRLLGGTIRTAIQYVVDVKIKIAVAKTVIWLADVNPHFLSDDDKTKSADLLCANPILRRALLKEILLRCETDSHKCSWLLRQEFQVYQPEDQLWLLQEFPKIPELAREKWLIFDRSTYDYERLESLDLLLSLRRKFPEIEMIYGASLNAIDLDSEEAKMLRSHYNHTTSDSENAERTVTSPSPSERIESLLSKTEEGDYDSWWQLVSALRLDEHNYYHGEWDHYDIEGFRNWKSMSGETRRRVLGAAIRYLQEKGFTFDTWIAERTFDQAQYAYYQALVYVWHRDRAALEHLSEKSLDMCAGVLLCACHNSGGEEASIRDELVSFVFRKAPGSVLRYFREILMRELQEGYVFTTDLMENIWCESISELIFQFVTDETYSEVVRGILLHKLLDKGSKTAFMYARELLNSALTSNPLDLDQTNFLSDALAGLLLYSKESEWDLLWSVLEKRQDIADKALGSFAHRRFGLGFANFHQKLSLEQKAILFTQLSKLYPHGKDPDEYEAQSVTNRECIGRFRDSLITSIVDTGSEDAVAMLYQLRDKLPHLDWLSHSIVRAKDLARRLSWVPATPDELKKLLQNPDSRKIESEWQLFELVREMLMKFELDLRGPTSRVHRLWNDPADRKDTCKYRPKDENTLSNELKLHLETALCLHHIVVNREVEIHARRPNSADYPDISVETFRNDGRRDEATKIGIVIEVKGNWYEPLEKRMESQLLNKYLNDNTCDHGLYAVGYFSCEAWDEDDYRKKNARRNGDIGGLREKLEKKATELSRSGKTVQALVLDCSMPALPTK